jgi:hypothetical protein
LEGVEQEGMEYAPPVLEILVADLVRDHGAGEHVKRAGFEVDHGRGRDTNFRADKRARHDVFGKCGDAAGFIEKVYFPKRRIAGAIRIQGVDAVVFCGDVKNVVRAFAGDRYGRLWCLSWKWRKRSSR